MNLGKIISLFTDSHLMDMTFLITRNNNLTWYIDIAGCSQHNSHHTGCQATTDVQRVVTQELGGRNYGKLHFTKY